MPAPTLGTICLEEDKPQYNTLGLQLGERYEGSALVTGDGSPPPPDPWDTYTPHLRAGARLPHAWVGDDRALIDDLGAGFTLLDFDPARGRAAGLVAAASAQGVALNLVNFAAPPTPVYRDALVLVRPDQHIAWAGTEAPAEPARDHPARAGRRHSPGKLIGKVPRETMHCAAS